MNRKRGFTLIELLVVIAIIALLVIGLGSLDRLQITRHGDRREDADDQHDDHQLDERETLGIPHTSSITPAPPYVNRNGVEVM